ncbi:MAG: ABC transporter permease [Bacillaceae bacterium]|nr:ABC transporter permease [Bacillaceae bacterium]
MTFRQFAFNNIRRNARQYISYFLSSMFAVTIFFMYAVVMFHPDVMNSDLRKSVQYGITAAEIIIFTFSFLFVLYSTGTFIKSRQKEFGLLTTLGISRSQLNRLLFIENSIIGFLSIVSGILLGAILSKVFLLTFSNILDLNEPLSYFISPLAVAITAGSYFVMFELNILFVLLTIRTKSIMELFRGAKAAKKMPRFSWFLSFLSLILIGSGYYLAWTADLLTIVQRMFPILLLVIPGTYFFFTQLSVALASMLKKRKALYYRGTNILTFSDLIYKIKDNARILFFVSILSAVAFTSSGVLFGAFYGLKEETEKYTPNTLSFTSKGNGEIIQEKVKLINKELTEKGIPYSGHYSRIVHGRVPDFNGKEISFRILSLSDFQTYQSLNQMDETQLQENEAILLLNAISAKQFPDEVTVNVSNYEETFSLKKIQNTVLNSRFFGGYLLVLPDSQYAQLEQVSDPSQTVHFHAIEIENWTNYLDEIQGLLQTYNLEHLKFTDTDQVYIENQAEMYTSLKQGFGLTLYFGIFISVLFFLAAGSILYFRMYQDIDQDLSRYRSLYKIGLTRKEMKQIATRELSFLFFVPIIMAIIHSGFAFKALQNMLSASVLFPSLVIFGSFLAIHLVNFMFVRNIYITKLKKVM